MALTRADVKETIGYAVNQTVFVAFASRAKNALPVVGAISKDVASRAARMAGGCVRVGHVVDPSRGTVEFI